MQTMLERIADAEKQADLVLEEANRQARESVAAAKEQAETAVAEAAEAEREKTAQALAKAETDGQALGESILSGVRGEISSVRAAAESKLPDAVTYLLERIEATL